MSATRNTKPFHSVKFNRTVRLYRDCVIVPIDGIGSRGGDVRWYEIWTNDQRTRLNRRGIQTLSDAKKLIDSGAESQP